MNILKKYQSKVDALAASVEKQRESISSNDQWTDQAKADALFELAEKTKLQKQDLREQLKNERIERASALEKKLYSVGDDPVMQMSYRDALKTASLVAAELDQLSDLMDQAIDTGDKALAKAAAFTATKNGNFDLARRAFDEGAYQNYFDEYISIQEALSNPISKEAIDESFLFSALS